MTWYDFFITQDYGQNGETGRDFGTPNNTPVFFPVGGKVIASDYQVYGGEVAVAIPGKNLIQYFIHLNDIYVKPGDTVQPGQIIGTTGGGIGDKILKNGVVQVATSQYDYQGHSSGYHVEYGLFKGNTASDFNSAWNNVNQHVNPIPFVDAFIKGGIGGANQFLGTSGNIVPLSDTSSSSPTSNPLDIQGSIQSWFINTFTPIVTKFVGITGFLIVVIVLVAFGLLLLTGNTPINDTREIISKHQVLKNLEIGGK